MNASLWHMLRLEETTDDRLRSIAARGAEAIVLPVEATRTAIPSAIDRAAKLGLRVWGWISVGRDEEAASLHPEWLHAPPKSDWLGAFPDWSGGPSACVWPYVCVNNSETFAWAVQKVWRLANAYPGLEGILLADVQGAPTGCGCGSAFCRAFDNSPGPKIAQAAEQAPGVCFTRLFVEACRDACPMSLLAPVLWLDPSEHTQSECEAVRLGYSGWLEKAFEKETLVVRMEPGGSPARLTGDAAEGRLFYDPPSAASWRPVEARARSGSP